MSYGNQKLEVLNTHLLQRGVYTKSFDLEQSSTNLITTHVLRADAQELEARSWDEGLHTFWELESMGIQGPERTWHDEFSSSVEFDVAGTRFLSHGRKPESQETAGSGLFMMLLQDQMHRL